MHPVLLELPGGFAIHFYGALLALAVFQAAFLMERWGDQDGLPGKQLYDMAFWTLLGGLVGARAEYVRVNWPEFQDNLLTLLNLRQGGLVFYGGLVGALLTFTISARRRNLPVGKVLDVIAPTVPLGHVWGRLGCFFSGCCYGRPATDSPLTITFTDKHCWDPSASSVGGWNPEGLPVCIPEPLFTPLHATQFYEAGYCLVLGIFLIWMRGHRKFSGQLILTYLSIYPILRSINETFRGDTERGFFMEYELGQVISNAQFISLCIVCLSMVAWVTLWRRAKQTSPAPSSAESAQ